MNLEAQRLFSESFFTTQNRFSSVLNFRHISGLGFESGKSALWAQEIEGAAWLIHDPENQKLFNDKEKFIEAMGGVEGFAARNFVNNTENFRASVDGASLVFAHALLDSAAMDYCKVAALLEPEAFLSYIAERKVSIGEVLANSPSDLLRAKVENFLQNHERESLLRKIDVLFALCKPMPDFRPVRSFDFELERVKELDQLRHDMVHKAGPSLLPKGTDDIRFLRDTTLYLMGMTSARFKVKINPSHL